MKIAVVSGLRRREGDLGEFFLLRAIHEAAYLDADTFIVTGGLCASPSEKLDFIDILNASIERRKLSIRVLWMRSENDPADFYRILPDPANEMLDGLSVSAFLSLLGDLPEMTAPEYRFLTAELNHGRIEPCLLFGKHDDSFRPASCEDGGHPQTQLCGALGTALFHE